MKTIFISLLFFSFCFPHSFAQTTLTVELQKNSSIVIQGSSNLVSFKLSQSGEALLKKSLVITATQTQDQILLSHTSYSILVNSFTSNNKMALRDFLQLVKSTIYPSLQVQLKHIEPIPKVLNSVYSKGQAFVNITITGVTKQYIIPISSEKKGDLYSFIGGKRIDIRDFGLTPPVKMMGLIKVSEWIDIEFNIFCKITSK